jgi:hypothetical protein
MAGVVLGASLLALASAVAADEVPGLPRSLAATRPGALLRQERFAGYAVPAGSAAVRILYSTCAAATAPH